MKRFIAILMTLIMVLGLSSVGVWADEATWQEETPMPTAKHGHTSEIWNNKIYVFGGQSGSTALNATAIYDIGTGIWSNGAPMPTARANLTSAVVNNKIYVIGGNVATSNSSAIEIYDPQSDSWTTGTPMPTARSIAKAVVVAGKIFVIGGSNTNYLNTVEIYDPETNSWTAGSPMLGARAYHTATVVNDKIYVIGGYKSPGGISNTIEIYNPQTGSWSSSPIPTPRYYPEAVVYGEDIYVMGGHTSTSVNFSTSIEIYNTVTNTWTQWHPLPVDVVSQSSSILNNKIYILGGYNSDRTTLNKVFSITLENKTEAPSSLTATGGNSVVDLSWGAASGADSYTVKRSLTAGGPYTVIAEGVTDTTYSDKDVVNGTTYYYVVTAVSAGGESANSNEASATPQAQTSSGRALLVITMTNGLEKEYDLQMSEVNSFVSWYDGKAAGNGQGYYTFNKNFNLGPFMNRTDYLTFDKIQNFEVMQYQ